MPVCVTELQGSRPTKNYISERDDFIKMINENGRVPENKIYKCANEESSVNFNSDSIIDIRRRRSKYKKSVKASKMDSFKGLELAKISTDDSFDGTNAVQRATKLSMNDLLHDLNRIRRISVASSDILGDNSNRIKKCDGNGMLSKTEKNRRKSTNSSLRAQHNAEMKSIILDPENSLHSPRQQNYELPQEIQDNVNSLEEWLQEMENTLQPLPLNSRWSKKAINEKMKELKAAHSDIESHGQLIKTVVELCDKYSRRSYKQRNQFLNNANRQRHSIRHQSRPPEGDPLQQPEVATNILPGQNNTSPEPNSGASYLINPKPPQLLSVGRVIERRWHCLWLKSLEWQCFLEQLTWTPRLRKKTLLKPRKSKTSSPEG